jgi:hypothetical protein
MRVKWDYPLLFKLYKETDYKSLRYFQEVIKQLADAVDVKLPRRGRG